MLAEGSPFVRVSKLDFHCPTVTLQTRIYAMYGNSRKMLYFLLFTFTATFGVILSFIIRIVVHERGKCFAKQKISRGTLIFRCRNILQAYVDAAVHMRSVEYSRFLQRCLGTAIHP